MATCRLQTFDDFTLDIGDTIPIDDTSMGVRRHWLIEGVSEDASGVSLSLIDVIGG